MIMIVLFTLWRMNPQIYLITHSKAPKCFFYFVTSTFVLFPLLTSLSKDLKGQSVGTKGLFWFLFSTPLLFICLFCSLAFLSFPPMSLPLPPHSLLHLISPPIHCTSVEDCWKEKLSVMAKIRGDYTGYRLWLFWMAECGMRRSFSRTVWNCQACIWESGIVWDDQQHRNGLLEWWSPWLLPGMKPRTG